MKKKHTLMNYLPPLSAEPPSWRLAVGCTADDELDAQAQGSIPLQVGDVTAAGMKPAHMPQAETQVPVGFIGETPATGYTGIRKIALNGDA